MPGLKELGLWPDAPALETLLARADVIETEGGCMESTLFGLFGAPGGEAQDPPGAPVCRLADGGAADDAFWMHADPVFLKPGSDRLLLFDAGMLEIRPRDAEELAALFNRHFERDGWRLEALRPDRWYLRLPGAPDLITHPLGDVIGRSIGPFLPAGGEASQWRSRLNEIQMLFHSAGANARRESEGLAPVNGVWLSGGGYLPQSPSAPFDEVIADIPLARGFARLSGTPCRPLPADGPPRSEEKGERLVVYHRLLRPVLDADPRGWVEAVGRFGDWAGALRRMLQKKRLDVLEIHPCNGSLYRLDRGALRRFWKMRRAMPAGGGGP